VKLKAEFRVSKVQRTESEPLGNLLRLAFLDKELGYKRVAPREALERFSEKNRVYAKWMRKHTVPSLVLVAAHAIWFVLAFKAIV